MKNKEKRNQKAFKMYEEGKTFQEIANAFGTSRQMAQLMIASKFKKEIKKKYKKVNLTEEENRLLNVAIKNEVRNILFEKKMIRFKNKREERKKKLKAKMKLLPHHSKFLTLESYIEALGTSRYVFRASFPKMAKENFGYKQNRWTMNYDKCILCGTTATYHGGGGLCKNCYTVKWRKKRKNKMINKVKKQSVLKK